MTLFPDPIPFETARHLDRLDMQEQTTAKAHERLFVEMAEALAEDPTREVAAPDYRGRWTAARLVVDLFDEDMAADLLRIVARAAQCTDPALRLSAQAWQASFARKHADLHCDAAAERDE